MTERATSRGTRANCSAPSPRCERRMSGRSDKLQVEGRTRDLAMFNLAIDSKLRGCDVVGLKVQDVAPHGITIDRATVRKRKTGHPVRFELTEGHTKIESTVRYLGIEVDDALAIADQVDV
jgi:hypothetical protein